MSSNSYHIRWQDPLTPQSFTSTPSTTPGPILMLTPPPVASAARSQQTQTPASCSQAQVVAAVGVPQPVLMYHEIIRNVGVTLVSAMTERIAELELRCNELEREKAEAVSVTEACLGSVDPDALEDTETKAEIKSSAAIPYEEILHELAIVDVLLDGALHYSDMPVDGA